MPKCEAVNWHKGVVPPATHWRIIDGFGKKFKQYVCEDCYNRGSLSASFSMCGIYDGGKI